MINQLLTVIVMCSLYTSNAFIIVEHNDTSHSACNQTNPCTNLSRALHEMRSGSKMIISAGDNYTLHGGAMMCGMDSIVIVGDGSDNTVITCDNNTGLAFINMHNITIANLTLKQCGAWRNSTTQNGTNNFTLQFRCGIYFLESSDVTMYDVMVTNSPGTGIMMYDVVGTITIRNSRFINNRVPTADVDTVPGGGGVYIEFTYCLPNTTNFKKCKPRIQANSIYLIHSCTFHGNVGTTNEEKSKNIFPIGSISHQFGRGGGLSTRFKGNAINNTITIKHCTIRDNRALWGGGIYVNLLDSAQNNCVIIANVTFSSNSVPIENGTGGGAIRVRYYPQINRPSNIVNITGCIFDNNSAYYGGAFSLSTRRETEVFDPTNGITLEHCIWSNNFAQFGSAVDLTCYFDEPNGRLVVPVFKNCTFVKNYNVVASNKLLQIGFGSLHSDGISFSIEGANYFFENTHTALAVIDTTVEFKENSSAVFVNNQGYRGGAMSLLGNTWLSMHPNTKVLFEGNSADDKGGAIYYVSAGMRDVNSRKCFIRYYDYMTPPTKWDTNFTFINNNSSNPGHDIYCTTLLTCSWDNTSIVTTPEALNETFRWKNVFTYFNENEDTIATDPANTNINIETLKIPPGQLRYLNFSVKDDTGALRRTVFFVRSNDSTAANVASTSTYISDNQVELLGSPGNSFQLEFLTITTRVLSFKVNTTLAKCPPGFYFPKDTASNSSHHECVCSAYDRNEKYDPIPYCHENTTQAFLQPQFWAGYIQGNTILVTGKCPPGYCYADGNSNLKLPSEANKYELNRRICFPNNRNGTLCGRCKDDDHYIYANAKDYKCGKCSIKYGPMWQLFTKYIPLIIFLLTIVLLDINLASGLLNTFVFFSQMLPSLDLYAGGQIPISDAAKPFVEFYQFCYGMFNLQYFESLSSVPNWCTVKYQSALTGVMFDYIVAFCPLLIIFIVWLIIFSSDCCVYRDRRNIVRRIANKLRHLYNRIKPNDITLSDSFFRNLVTFMMLSYTKFTLVTLTLLTPAYLSGPGGKQYDIVAYLDGTLEYFGHEHLMYVIPAIFVLVFIVILPLVLFAMYPFMCNWLGISVHKMMPFFDTLYGAFKNEHKLYYFSLLYFVYRIVLVAIFTFIQEVEKGYVIQQIFGITVLMLHVIAQPYKERKHNVVDICLLALTPTVISISFFQLFSVTNSGSVSQLAMAFQITLLYIPLIYLATVIVYKLYQWRRHNYYIPNNGPLILNSNPLFELNDITDYGTFGQNQKGAYACQK